MSNQDTPLTQKYKLYITNDGLDSNTSDITKRICIFNQSNTKITYNSKEMKLSLNGVSFRRRIYEPGHIEAEIQIGYSDSSNTPKLAELQTMFIKKKVDLEIAIEKVKKDTVLAKNYYIHEICPLYSSTSKDTSIYVRLSIFSMDKLMTLNKYSQAFLGRKFGTGIMIPSATDFSLKNEKSTYSGVISTEVGSLQNLSYKPSGAANDVEFIQPYLVQYNESFYDFLVRVANRCGEFLFFEDGKLQLGLDSTKLEADAKTISTYSKIYYQQISAAPLSIDDYGFDSMKDNTNKPEGSTGEENVKQIDKEDDGLPKDLFPTSYRYNSEVGHDDQYMLLYKDHFADFGFFDCLGSWDQDLMTLLSTILNSTSLLECIGKLGVWIVENGIQGKLGQDKKQSTGNEVVKDFGGPDATVAAPFASIDTESWLTVSSYSSIKKVMEEQGRKMVCVDAGSDFVNVKLGDKVKLPIDDTTEYLVVQIDMQADQDWQSDYEDNYSGSSVSQQGGRLLKFYLIPKASAKFYPPLCSKPAYRQSGTQTAYVMDNSDPKGQGRVRIRYPWQLDVSAQKKVLTDQVTTLETNLENEKDENSENAKKLKAQIFEKKLEAVLLDASSPWIRMTTPMATTGGGMYFKPEIGDEVLVDFENGNVERPYVVGTLYSKNVVYPGADRIIKSPNGHTIKIEDPTDGMKFLAGMYPGLKFLQSYQLWPSDAKISGMNEVLGGITMTDTYGLYKIQMSSHDRKVSISSPFGDVKIDAFTGITLSAPNGDIKIKGKNVSISASNNVTITSGTNIKPINGEGNWFKAGWTMKNATKSLASSVLEASIGNFFDFSLLRSLMEVFLRPIDGTLEVKSYRFLNLIAGGGYAEVDDGLYKKAGTNLRHKDGNDGYAVLGNMVVMANARIEDFIDKYVVAYLAMKNAWAAVKILNLYAENNAIVTTPNSEENLFQAIYNTEAESAELQINNLAFSDGVLEATKTNVKNAIITACNAAVKLKAVANGYPKIYETKVSKVKKLLHIDKMHQLFAEKGQSVMTVDCPMKETVDKTKQYTNNTKAFIEMDVNAEGAKRVFQRRGNFIKRKLVSDVLEATMGSLSTYWHFKLSKRNDGVSANNAVDNGGEDWTAYINNIDIPVDDTAGSSILAGLTTALLSSTKDNLSLEHDVWAPGTKGEILFANNTLETMKIVNQGFVSEKNMYVTQADKKKVVGRIRELLMSFG